MKKAQRSWRHLLGRGVRECFPIAIVVLCGGICGGCHHGDLFPGYSVEGFLIDANGNPCEATVFTVSELVRGNKPINGVDVPIPGQSGGDGEFRVDIMVLSNVPTTQLICPDTVVLDLAGDIEVVAATVIGTELRSPPVGPSKIVDLGSLVISECPSP